MLAFTFPGQGSQRQGMGAGWIRHPSWELVEHGSEVIDRDIAQLLLRADQESLTATANAQVATFVLSLVILDAAERLGIEPASCAGHSLGEYSALVAAGSLSFEDGLRLVAERANAMQKAADDEVGTMMAVLGLDDDSVAAACVRSEGRAWVANYNAPGQVVIAGAPEALERVAEIAKELGAKRILRFPVGGAFHTPLMEPARERLRKALSEASFRDPEPFVVANVDARAHREASDWPGLLSAQLCSPVRWRQSLECLWNEGMSTFVELGPGGVLTGLVKRSLTDESVKAYSISSPDELESLLEELARSSRPARSDTSATEDELATFFMTERLVVSPATGPFRAVEVFSVAQPRLLEESVTALAEIAIEVGQLIGWAGEEEIRSPFAGTLQGIIVLDGERVVAGQPVAWLRSTQEEGQT